MTIRRILTLKETRLIYKDGRLPSRLEATTLFVDMPEEEGITAKEKRYIKGIFE